jgi:hypothetical protein
MKGAVSIDSGVSMRGTCSAFETVVTYDTSLQRPGWETTGDR